MPEFCFPSLGDLVQVHGRGVSVFLCPLVDDAMGNDMVFFLCFLLEVICGLPMTPAGRKRHNRVYHSARSGK